MDVKVNVLFLSSIYVISEVYDMNLSIEYF